MAATLIRLVSLYILIITVKSRFLRLNTFDDHLISDGIDHVEKRAPSAKPVSSPSIPTTCDHLYGFLPCAENAFGHIFLIVVYQLLLMFGEKQIGSGSRVLFSILGVGKTGGIIFRILTSLPSMVLVIVSGVFSSKENAQSQVSLGVGIYAGITVFSLTVQWGICVVHGRRELIPELVDHAKRPASACFPVTEKLASLKGTGVIIDRETRTAAGIVVLSLVPYIVVQFVDICKTCSGTHIMTLVALIVSTLSLLAYFAYQIWDPRVQKRSLDYAKYEVLRTGFLKHVQHQGVLVDEDGKLNTEVLRKLFDETDENDDGSISKKELTGLVLQVIQSGKVKVDEKDAMTVVLRTFDFNDDRSITEQEFIEGSKKWIDETMQSSGTSDSSSKNIFHELFKIFKEKKENDPNRIDKIMSKILSHAQTQLLKSESLITEDGQPNVECIQTLFKKFDKDGDQTISASELQQLISTVKFGEMPAKSEDIIKELFKDFDEDGDHIINEPEFQQGMSKWLKRAASVSKTSNETKAIEEFDKIVWKKTVYGKWSFITSVSQVILGILILTFLSGPLTSSILQLSYAMSLPSFSISFVIVPLALNARAAITALMPAKQKSERSASLIFSEIYGAVIMNNIAGLTTLLAIVYAKDLTWDFSAEVLTILVVGAVIGILASRCTTYPLWTCILAFVLYPLSLALYYFALVFLGWN